MLMTELCPKCGKYSYEFYMKYSEKKCYICNHIEWYCIEKYLLETNVLPSLLGKENIIKGKCRVMLPIHKVLCGFCECVTEENLARIVAEEL